MGQALCWICEKPLDKGSGIIIDPKDGLEASACKKCVEKDRKKLQEAK